jgi:hypothetical protein
MRIKAPTVEHGVHLTDDHRVGSGKLFAFSSLRQPLVSVSNSMRGTLPRLILILMGTLVGLMLGEIIVRAFHLGHTRTVFEYNNKLVKLRPHAGFMNYRENSTWVEINNLGFHDHDRQATNGNYRILFLGDSFLQAQQVDTENLFTIRLEAQFIRDGQKIETINGGVPGTGTAYQYVLWKEFFEPQVKINHLVLCVFMGNDLSDNSADLADPDNDGTIFLDSEGNILHLEKQPGRFKKIINYGRDHSALLNTSYENAYRLKKTYLGSAGTGAGLAQETPKSYGGAWEATVQGTIARVRRWKSELSEKKIPFDLVMIDKPGKVYNRFELQFIDQVQAACAQDQIGFLRLRLSADPYETYSFDGIALGHFNWNGHELVARELYDFFKSHHGAMFTLATR